MADHFHIARCRILREGLDLSSAHCLEVGPLNKPVLLKSETSVIYIDHADTDSLRRQYADNSSLDVSDIVEVDAVWGERSLADCVSGEKLDYVVASHVAEHVPDLVTWLQEVHEVLKPNGELRTVWPDCRFSFDVLRRETSLSEILTNYVLKARRPTVANVLDFRLHYAPDMWGVGRFEGCFHLDELRPAHPFQLAIDSACWARDLPDVYSDVHCWVFQPKSLAAVMARLASEGLVKFACKRLMDPTAPALEFFAFLAPCEDAARAAESWRVAAAAARDPIPGSAEARRIEAENTGRSNLERELSDARAALEIMRQSTSWRITAPVRRLAAKLKK